VTREDLLHHARTVAAAEVGLPASAFVDGVVDAGPAPATPATELSLRQLVDRYCDAVARRDEEAWAATWTEDAVWDLGRGEIKGRDDIVAAWVQAMDGFEWVVQIAPLAVFEVDETAGRATGRVTVQERFRRRDGATGTLLATYHDVYERSAAGWRFAARHLQVIDLS
jgi:ketosteroid isomerase-like protein